MEADLKSLLCEKEELVIERDAYKMKTDRLNNELNYILNGDENRVIDLDQLIAENRYLKERLKNAQEETGMTKAALSKYKVNFLRLGYLYILVYFMFVLFLGSAREGKKGKSENS